MNDKWILIAIAIVQLIQIVGRWSGKIDTSSSKNAIEIDRLRDWRHKTDGWKLHISKQQQSNTTDIEWIKKLMDRRNVSDSD